MERSILIGTKYLYQWRKRKSIRYGMFRVLSFVTPPSLFRCYNWCIKIMFKKSVKTRTYKKHWYRPIWKTLRSYRLYLDKYTCTECGKKKPTHLLRCHHDRYDRVDTEYEILDCRIVCSTCHEKIHKK